MGNSMVLSPPPSALTLRLNSLADTEKLAEFLASCATSGDVITLSGDLGTGKTAFCRAFIQRWCGEAIEVPSPTFTLVNSYETSKGLLSHCDLYRLESVEEAYELGLEDAFAYGITLIEWPAIVEALLPIERLDLHFRFLGEGGSREVSLVPHGVWQERLHGVKALGIMK
ncbi:MAG: tRNA ((37)-N6)-threonylcarbamoyltransferase complex ATPase subunit type 1 TsaE [Rickettsiales bacterium]|jgi:tRNA threonylcarbamoyladenosine biosynthesis protein TsaE|nr:tRNA ((37)-N6)-threonylcarbamoyltransferase complex ATPase subunit type 1 TsaE [Rickettsiales bacterium]